MDKRQQLLSRFSMGMKRGLSRVLHSDEQDNKPHQNAELYNDVTLNSLTKPITLTLSADGQYHNSLITANGCPDPKQFPCIIRWYNDELIEIYESTKSVQFQPNAQDAQHKIYCQWFPTDEGDDTSTCLPSKLAEIGPLKRNPALVQDAQSILDKGKGEFDIIIPKISKTEKQKLVIEGTKIHIYINTKNFKQTISKSQSPHLSSEELKSSDEAKLSADFENSVLDVTMTRYIHSMNEINEEQDNDKEDNDDNDVWMQTYRIKPEYAVNLSRYNLLEFRIENGKGSVMLKALSATIRERDILAIVIGALADAKMKRKQKKKRSHDLVEVRIDILDDINGKKTKTSIELQNQIRELQFQGIQIHEKMVNLQKDNIYLTAEKEKFMTDLQRLREAGLLKRDEINKLSEENMKYNKETEILNNTIKELTERIEEMENEKEKRDEEIREAQNENDDKTSESMQLQNEIDGLCKKLELKDSKIREFEIEIANLEDDRNQLRLTLNHLNAHVGKVQDDKSQMDQDFGSLNEEMIKYKKESRGWKGQYNTILSKLETLEIDYENLEKQLKFEQSEHEKKKVELKQNELEKKELNDQIKQMKELKKEYKDIKYEIAGKDEQIQRLKVENEQLRTDLTAENNQCTKNMHKIQRLSKKLDKATTKNAKLQSQIDEFEDRVTDSVARPLYNELQKELEDYKNKLNDIINDRDEGNKEISKLKALNSDFKQMVDKLTKENEMYRDEMNQLQTHNTFWKNKVKSMREEIKKLHSQPVPSPINIGQHNQYQYQYQSQYQQHNKSPSPSNSNDSDDDNSEKTKLQKQLKKIEKEKNEALEVVDQLKKALNNELQKANSVSMKNKILNSYTNEEVKTLIRKNNALKLLANELSDTVADKEQNIMHLKKVMKLLGTRVTELEKINNTLRSSINEIDVLENTHALSTEMVTSSDNKPTIIIAKKQQQQQQQQQPQQQQ